MENEYIGKNMITFNKKLVEDTYSALNKTKQGFKITYCIIVGFLGVIFIFTYIFMETFESLFLGLISLFMALIVFTSFYKTKKNLKNTLTRTYNANSSRVTTVLYYEDKIDVNTKWNQGYSIYSIKYSDVTSVYMSKNTIVLLFNHDTLMLNIVEETLEKINSNQIIQKIKENNPKVKIIKR